MISTENILSFHDGDEGESVLWSNGTWRNKPTELMLFSVEKGKGKSLIFTTRAFMTEDEEIGYGVCKDFEDLLDFAQEFKTDFILFRYTK